MSFSWSLLHLALCYSQPTYTHSRACCDVLLKPHHFSFTLAELESLKKKRKKRNRWPEWVKRDRERTNRDMRQEGDKESTNLHNVCHSRTRDLLAWVQPSSGGFAHQSTTSAWIPVHSAGLGLVQPALLAYADSWLQLRAGGWMGCRAALRAAHTRGCCCRCAGARAAGAAWARSPTHLQLRHSQVLDSRGQTLDPQQAARVAEFQVGHLVDEGTEGGASIFQVVRAEAGGGAGSSSRRGGLDLGRGCVRCLGCRMGGGRDLGVHGEAVEKLIDGCYWLIPEAVVFGTVKHTLLSLALSPLSTNRHAQPASFTSVLADVAEPCWLPSPVT